MNCGRLRFRGPIPLLFSPAPWTAFWYLFCSIFLGALWFSIAFTLLAAGVTLGVLWLGLPVLAAALAVTRGLANVERRRLRIDSAYRSLRSTGFRARLAERLRDPATRRDTILLVALWPALLVIDTVATGFWLGCFELMSLPIWYRYVPNTFDNGAKMHGVAFGNYPNGPYGGGNRWGFFVHDTRSAVIAAAVGLVLLVVAGNYLVVAAARAHAAITRALLGRVLDPLADARRMLIADPTLAPRAAQ